MRVLEVVEGTDLAAADAPGRDATLDQGQLLLLGLENIISD